MMQNPRVVVPASRDEKVKRSFTEECSQAELGNKAGTC